MTTQVFFEETSLVARPGLPLKELERRTYLRLEHLGVELKGKHPDEPDELSYIPMGGPPPDANQRVIAFGAAAALVHPATGYQLCRMLAAAPKVADALITAHREKRTPDAAARAAYAAVWCVPESRRILPNPPEALPRAGRAKRCCSVSSRCSGESSS